MRILRYIAVGTISVIVLAFTIFVTVGSWVQKHTFEPSPANESAFLKTYNSKPLIQPFREDSYSFSEGRGSGGGSGMKVVTHSSEFEEFLTMRADREASLMLAANDDIAQHLVESGALILAQTGNRATGFRFDYTTGNTIGTVTIHPLQSGKVQRNMPLPAQLQDVDFKIEIIEQWFPKGLPKNAFAQVVRPR